MAGPVENFFEIEYRPTIAVIDLEAGIVVEKSVFVEDIFRAIARLNGLGK